MPKSLEQDYIDLFTYTRKGHMAKYVHMYRPNIYDEVLRQKDYYPFRMEVDLLTLKANQICRNLEKVTQALEIGPGSSTPIMFKTIPLLKALEKQFSFSTYVAMDSNQKYARQACELIKMEFKTINTEAIEFDFLSEVESKKMKYERKDSGRTLVFALGQAIFSNNNDEGVKKFLNNIGKILKDGDYLLFGTDTNRDENMLKAAYDSKIVHELLLNAMYHLKNELNPKGFEPDKFDTIYKWNKEACTVENYLRPNQNQRFRIEQHDIILRKNHGFNILNSRKMDINSIRHFLSQELISIKEIVTLDSDTTNTYSMVIAQKNCF